MSTVQSRKAKGRRLQKKVVEEIRNKFPFLTENDIFSRSMGSGGEDIILSAKALAYFPFSVECKNSERLNIWNAIEQAESNTKENTSPLVVFSKNRSKIYAVLEFSDFLSLVGYAINGIRKAFGLDYETK